MRTQAKGAIEHERTQRVARLLPRCTSLGGGEQSPPPLASSAVQKNESAVPVTPKAAAPPKELARGWVALIMIASIQWTQIYA